MFYCPFFSFLFGCEDDPGVSKMFALYWYASAIEVADPFTLDVRCFGSIIMPSYEVYVTRVVW